MVWATIKDQGTWPAELRSQNADEVKQGGEKQWWIKVKPMGPNGTMMPCKVEELTPLEDNFEEKAHEGKLFQAKRGWTHEAAFNKAVRDAKSSLGDTKSSLCDATSSLGYAKSSLGDTLRARWVTLRARWVTLRARWVTLSARRVTRYELAG